MLGTSRLLSFAFRALITLLIVTLLWINIAKNYNQALTALASPFLPTGTTVQELDNRITFGHPRFADDVIIDGLTFHFGLVLLSVLVIAASDIQILPRLYWLAGFGLATFVVHVIGIILLAAGLVWSTSATSPTYSTRLVMSVFAIFWGLIPPLAGGIWCFVYWLPKTVNKTVSPSSDGNEI